MQNFNILYIYILLKGQWKIFRTRPIDKKYFKNIILIYDFKNITKLKMITNWITWGYVSHIFIETDIEAWLKFNRRKLFHYFTNFVWLRSVRFYVSLKDFYSLDSQVYSPVCGPSYQLSKRIHENKLLNKNKVMSSPLLEILSWNEYDSQKILYKNYDIRNSACHSAK